MPDPTRILFIHGSESSSQTYKASILRGIFPGMLVPDFTGTPQERMMQLERILGKKIGWILIGSSLGGMMAALFTVQHPDQVQKLILLAPALTLPEFTSQNLKPVQVPTILVHGTQDTVLPINTVRIIAESVFTSLDIIVVDDDHRLHKTSQAMDWEELLA
jgi:pimeloyl-ACP methyl ester carboxylesterase